MPGKIQCPDLLLFYLMTFWCPYRVLSCHVLSVISLGMGNVLPIYSFSFVENENPLKKYIRRKHFLIVFPFIELKLENIKKKSKQKWKENCLFPLHYFISNWFLLLFSIYWKCSFIPKRWLATIFPLSSPHGPQDDTKHLRTRKLHIERISFGHEMVSPHHS